jgi:RNA polymerase sigma-70 factor (sigma-E family)
VVVPGTHAGNAACRYLCGNLFASSGTAICVVFSAAVPDARSKGAVWPLLDAPASDFDSYVRQQSSSLLRLAYLLTCDHHQAEDLVQTTLAKVLPRWQRTVARGDPHAYVRTVMLHTAFGWRRRKWTGEQPSETVPDQSTGNDPAVVAAGRESLRVALLALPPRQRAAVVLRHYEDLSEAQAAAALGCSLGTVKSQTSKGLDRLRILLSEPPESPKDRA